jgi:hypothetical protein
MVGYLRSISEKCAERVTEGRYRHTVFRQVDKMNLKESLEQRTMTLHLRPETQARLEANAAALGLSIDEYLEALLEKDAPPGCQEECAPSWAQFQQEHGIWVYRTGEPMAASLVDDTLDAVRREREARLLGKTP